MLKNLIGKYLIVGASFLAPLFLAQSAQAIIFDWQFTNESGNVGNPTDIVAGEVEFNDTDVVPNATGVAATRLEITSVTGLNSSSAPFFGDGGIELNQNILLSSQIDPTFTVLNSASFDSSKEILSLDLDLRLLGDDGNTERFAIRTDTLSFLNAQTSSSFPTYRDSDNSTLTFTQQSVPVPFEVDATLGLLLVGSISGISYFKRKSQERRN